LTLFLPVFAELNGRLSLRLSDPFSRELNVLPCVRNKMRRVAHLRVVGRHPAVLLHVGITIGWFQSFTVGSLDRGVEGGVELGLGTSTGDSDLLPSRVGQRGSGMHRGAIGSAGFIDGVEPGGRLVAVGSGPCACAGQLQPLWILHDASALGGSEVRGAGSTGREGRRDID
jgi:hypothetical protein